MHREDFSVNYPSKAFHAKALDLCSLVGRTLFQKNDVRTTRFGVLDGTERIWARKEEANYPAWMYLDCGDCGVFVVGGAVRAENIAAFIAERYAIQFGADNRWFSDIVVLMGNYLYNSVFEVVGTLRSPTYIIGYSLGGCVGYYLSWKLSQIAQQTAAIYTYGSPRPGGVAAQMATGRVPLKRYYRIADPVRCLPPHFSEAYSLWPLINQATRNKWNAQVQPVGGVCIDDAGFMTESEDLSPILGGGALVSAARYYLGLETDYSSLHSIQEYADVISRGPAETRLPGPIGPSRPRELPAEPTLAEERRAIQIGVAIQGEAEENPVLARVIQFTQQAPTQSNEFRVRKRDGVWTVEQDGVVVDVGPGKRGARRKSKAYNRAMRRS